MELIVGTNNQQKLTEMQTELALPDVQLVSYQFYKKITERPIETGTTYEENARQKAHFYQQRLQRPVLGDDGGLEFAAFPALLGVRTSRFFQSDDPAEQNQELLDLFVGTDKSREVKLSTTLVYAQSETAFLVATAALVGELVEPRGTGGHGFDSVIYLPELGKTLAELSPQQRAAQSPRIRALREMIRQIKGETA